MYTDAGRGLEKTVSDTMVLPCVPESPKYPYSCNIIEEIVGQTWTEVKSHHSHIGRSLSTLYNLLKDISIH